MGPKTPHQLALDPFSRLPNELLLEIAKDSHSFSSLWSVVQASPSMRALLNTHAPTIINEIIQKTIPIQTQLLIRGVIQLRASSGESSWLTLSEARSIYASINLGEFDNGTAIDAKLAARLPSLAHKIHTLAHCCVEHYVQKCMSMRPSALIKMGPGFMRNNNEAYDQAEGNPFRPPRTGPPSWVEEQRLILAFWRIQFFLELRLACNQGRLGWRKEDSETLRCAHLDTFCRELTGYKLEQTLTAYEYIQDLDRGNIDQDNYQLPSPPIRDEYVDGCLPRPPISHTFRDDPGQQGENWLCREPFSIAYQRVMARSYRTTPLPNLPFKPYRKFGFALWDNKRMTELGFSLPGGYSLLRYREYFYTWYSVLTEEEKAR